MKEIRNSQDLFLSSGCVSQKGIRLYLSGAGWTDFNSRVNDHLESCDLCREAVEGLKIMQEEMSLDKSMELTGRINDKIEGSLNDKILFSSGRSGIRTYLALAASIILIAGSYLVFHYAFKNQRSNFTMGSKPEKPSNILKVPDKDSSRFIAQKINISPAAPEDKSIETIKSTETVNTLNPNRNIILQEKDSEKSISEVKGIIAENKIFQEDTETAAQGRKIPSKTDQGNSQLKIHVKSKTDTRFLPSNRNVINNASNNNINKNDYETEITDPVFIAVQEFPSFPGGEDSLKKYLFQNLKDPQSGNPQKIQGIVLVSFIVEKDGKLSNVNIKKGFNYNCDNEAIRLIKSMPDWIPGKQSGQPVRVQMSVPIQFK